MRFCIQADTQTKLVNCPIRNERRFSVMISVPGGFPDLFLGDQWAGQLESIQSFTVCLKKVKALLTAALLMPRDSDISLRL